MSSDRPPKLFIPGPTEVRPEILAAGAKPMIGHRAPECSTLIGSINERLRWLLKPSGPVVLLSASANAAMEASLKNLVRPGKKALCLVCGAWGTRFADIAAACGIETVLCEAPEGHAVTPSQVAEMLDAHPDVDCVTTVFNDTSTGIVQPVAEIAEVVRAREDVLMVVDAVSGMAAEHIDHAGWGLDVCLAGIQKAFACPPGAAVMALSPAAMARAEQVPNRGFYFDFLRLARSAAKDQTVSTPPISVLYCLDAQLEAIQAEGMDARRARHVAMAELTRGWALERFGENGLFAAEGCRSITLTTVRNTRELNVADLIKRLRERHNAIFGNGYSALKEKTFRIGHMGDHTVEGIQELLGWIDGLLGD